MNREVYIFLLHTYGRKPMLWVGFISEVIRVSIYRVYNVFLIAQITTSIAAGRIDVAKQQTIFFFVIAFLGTIVGTIGVLLSTSAENQEYGNLTMTFYKKLINKDASFFRDNQTGYLTSVFRQHLDSAMLLTRFFRGEALGTTLSIMVPPIVLFIAAPGVGLIAIVVVLVQLIYVMWSSAKVNRYRVASHEVFRKITGEVSDVITNIIAFKSGGIEDQSEDKLAKLSQDETQVFMRRRTIVALLDLPRSIITIVGISAAIYLIVVHSTKFDPSALGLLILTITYMFQIVRNVGTLPDLITEHDDLVTKLHPTLRYLSNDYETIRDTDHPVPLAVKSGAIEFDHVSFSYPSHSHASKRIPVFHDLSLSIGGGEQMGVVGLSGAGKSTLANLMLRFDEIESGSIKIDGIDIRDVKQSELRRKIAYVPQEPLLFHRTVRENVAYYQDNQSDDEIVRASKAAHAHEFIERLPNQYDTIVGERGVKLSGGQKQRVVIARAILKKAPIMIFDEATSALDSESEQIIQRALPEILGKQTAIVIAHRLSTVAGLDRIIVMHEGSIVESGTHAELIALHGRYFSLWQKQTSEFGPTPGLRRSKTPNIPERT